MTKNLALFQLITSYYLNSKNTCAHFSVFLQYFYFFDKTFLSLIKGKNWLAVHATNRSILKTQNHWGGMIT